eukprot:561925-Rhodomonas_salina.1
MAATDIKYGGTRSGKTTLASKMSSLLNENSIPTSVLPMDGFHFYREELDKMSNPVEAHDKRGAHWTFNAERLVQTLVQIRDE